MKPDGRAPDTSPADGPAFEGPAFEGPAFDGTPLHLPHGAPTAQTLAWWAGGLLNAVAAADVSEDGEPILAAAGHAATAALLLLQHRAAGDGNRARLREAYGVSADQVAIVRELLQQRSPAAAPATPAASRPAATVTDPLRRTVASRQAGRPRHRRRRLRLIRGGR